MSPDCHHDRTVLAALVIEGFDESDRRAATRLVEECARCADEHWRLASVPPLLDRLDTQPDHVMAGRASTIDGVTRARRRRSALVGAAASVLLLLGFIGVAHLLTPPADDVVAVPLEMVAATDATGSIEVRTGEGPVIVRVMVTGLEPLAEPSVYEAWLYRYDGTIESLGRLEVDPTARAVDVTFEARSGAGDYRGFWITAEPDRNDPAHQGATVARTAMP